MNQSASAGLANSKNKAVFRPPIDSVNLFPGLFEAEPVDWSKDLNLVHAGLAGIPSITMEKNMTFQAIDIDQGKHLINEKNVTIVDVRDSAAYGSAHIENAQHINDGNVQAFVESEDKSHPLLVYCYHGHTSRGAAEYFASSGFTEVYSLDGGFESWRTKYPVKISG